MADNDSADQRGLRKRSELWGEKRARQGDEWLNDFDPDFARLLNEQIFGGIWCRPGLDTKSRSLITVAALLALGRTPELKLHMRGALNLGIPPAQVKELIIHLSQYAGVPAAIEAIRVFQELTAKKQE